MSTIESRLKRALDEAWAQPGVDQCMVSTDDLQALLTAFEGATHELERTIVELREIRESLKRVRQ